MISYPVNYTFDQGYFDVVQFERCGLIRLEGWSLAQGLHEFEFPKCFIAGEEIPLFQIFRIYRPDVATALQSHNSYQGLMLTYRVSAHLAHKPIELSFNGEIIFNKTEGFQVNEPAYVHLLDTSEVLHRQHIYGFGPPSSTVVDQIFQLAKTLPPPILDFGCGSGALVKKLRDEGIEAYGIELERAPIVAGILPEVKPFIKFYKGAFPLPYKTGEFQSVFATEVIEHMAAYGDALSEIARITSRNFTMTVPDISSIPVCYQNGVVPWHLLASTHVNFFTQTSLERLLEKHFAEVEFARVVPNVTNDSLWFASLVGICRKAESDAIVHLVRRRNAGQNGQSGFHSVDTVNGRPLPKDGPVFIDDNDRELTLAGWAIDQQAEAVAGGVYLSIDGRREVRAVYGIERPDVATFYSNPRYAASGFVVSIQTSLMKKGPHTLGLKVISADRQGYYELDQRIDVYIW